MVYNNHTHKSKKLIKSEIVDELSTKELTKEQLIKLLLLIKSL